jgi:hypothetical protein
MGFGLLGDSLFRGKGRKPTGKAAGINFGSSEAWCPWPAVTYFLNYPNLWRF